HLGVRHPAEPFPMEANQGGPSRDDRERARAFGREINFGFERVERLPGNVGYLEIRSFGFDTADVSSVAAAAFTFLGNTDALIIDVRRNGGGSACIDAQESS